MTEIRSLLEQWRDYRATKGTLAFACAASIALTLILGFTWGGWVTESTASERAANAATEARAQLAAAVCVERFLEAADVRAQLASLKQTNFWERDDFIEKGGWATPPGFDKPVEDAADLCATQLAETVLPAANNAGTASPATTVQ